MSPAERRAAEDLRRKRLLIGGLQMRGELCCKVFRGQFRTGLYFADLKRTNPFGVVTHYETAAGSTLIEALERLELQSRGWGAYERKAS